MVGLPVESRLSRVSKTKAFRIPTEKLCQINEKALSLQAEIQNLPPRPNELQQASSMQARNKSVEEPLICTSSDSTGSPSRSRHLLLLQYWLLCTPSVTATAGHGQAQRPLRLTGETVSAPAPLPRPVMMPCKPLELHLLHCLKQSSNKVHSSRACIVLTA